MEFAIGIMRMWSFSSWFTFCFILAVTAAVGTAAAATTANRRRSPWPSLQRSNNNNNSNYATTLSWRGGGKTSRRSGPTTGVVVGPWKVFTQTILDARRHLAAAAVARSTSIFIMYPADALKTRLQMQQADAFRLTGLFNGVGSSLIGQVPYGVLTFGSYELYKGYLLDRFPNVQPIFKYALAAVMGDLTGSGWLCPSEVIKQKLQAGMFPSTSAAVASIWKTKGLIGFYEGYLGGIARDVPFRVAQLTTYELTKNLYLRIRAQRRRRSASSSHRSTLRSNNNKNDEDDMALSASEAAFCGAVAGSFSAAITAPLDRIKTLLMTNSAAYGGTVVSCATKIWQEEGIRGLTTGVLPRVAYIAPSVAIFFVVYETTQQRLKHWQTQSTK